MAFNEIEAEQVARDAKKQAVEDRKAAAAAKREAKALQKLETAKKKAEKQAEKKSQVAKCVSARRNTVASKGEQVLILLHLRQIYSHVPEQNSPYCE